MTISAASRALLMAALGLSVLTACKDDNDSTGMFGIPSPSASGPQAGAVPTSGKPGGAGVVPRHVKPAAGAKWHDPKELCATVKAHLPKIAGFRPTEEYPTSELNNSVIKCELDDNNHRSMQVTAAAQDEDEGNGPEASDSFDHSVGPSAQPVSGIGDKAAVDRYPVQLIVLRGDNLYKVVVDMMAGGGAKPTDDQVIAAEKEIALAVV